MLSADHVCDRPASLRGAREKPLLETKASIKQDVPGVEVFTAPTDVTKRSDVESAFSSFLDGRGSIQLRHRE